MIISDIYFAFPRSFYLMVIPFIIALLFVIHNKSCQKMLSSFASSELLNSVVFPRSEKYFFRRGVCIFLAIAFMVIAFAQPQKTERNPVKDYYRNLDNYKKSNEESSTMKKKKFCEIVFLLDTSASMSVNDSRTGISRLEHAKEIIDDIVKKLSGEQVALYSFTSQVHSLVPSTIDYLFFRLFLRNVGFNEGDVAGTDLLQALENMKKYHQIDEDGRKIVNIFLLTDGGDTYLETVDGEQREKFVKTISNMVASNNDRWRLSAIGLGSAQGETIPGIIFEGNPVKSTLDEKLLETISLAGNGEYIFANKFSSTAIAEKIVNNLKKCDWEEEDLDVYEFNEDFDDNVSHKMYFQLFVGISILLITLSMLISPTTKKR